MAVTRLIERQLEMTDGSSGLLACRAGVITFVLRSACFAKEPASRTSSNHRVLAA
jgi:hypothetical protein